MCLCTVGVGNTSWHPAQLLQDTLWVQLPYMKHGTFYRYFREEVQLTVPGLGPQASTFSTPHATQPLTARLHGRQELDHTLQDHPPEPAERPHILLCEA